MPGDISGLYDSSIYRAVAKKYPDGHERCNAKRDASNAAHDAGKKVLRAWASINHGV